ncbi:hypothetical protein B296_00007234 [Ensete ventricosum]|uniref:Uncharacterized protein n=1 Tax=Ensete ventricosum TaxID=4639 RepID=A0A426Z0L9_ENSVE|nr:hypothetical protein B296_00007234 [Ensete ventricosum]
MVHYRPNSPQVLTEHTHIYKPKLATKETKTRAAKPTASPLLAVQDNGPKSSLGIRPGFDDAVGPHQEFSRRFAEGIGKLAGSTLGDHRKKTG